jgi:GNAT superfamily N-acetyltransferase
VVSTSIRLFTNQDIPSALELCRGAGWNQLQQDWARLIAYEPLGCFVAELDGQLVGTITTTRYGTDLAWIGMMLVREDFRRRGIATALMNAGLDYLGKQNVGCIKLDATPAGKPVYERLGFRAEWSFHRWVRNQDELSDRVPPTDTAATLTTTHIDLDRVAFAADRSRCLNLLIQESISCRRDRGFGMLRSGHLASYLGPVVAENRDVAREIIVELLKQSPGKTFWDPPEVNPDAVLLAESLGFQPIRDLTRMWIGSKSIIPAMNLQYAFSDPGTG